MWRRRWDSTCSAEQAASRLLSATGTQFTPARVRNPIHIKNNSLVKRPGCRFLRRRWDSLPAGEPRRLQCATGTLPRAAFRIPFPLLKKQKAPIKGCFLFFTEAVGFDLLCGAGRLAALECHRHSIHSRSGSNPDSYKKQQPGQKTRLPFFTEAVGFEPTDRLFAGLPDFESGPL